MKQLMFILLFASSLAVQAQKTVALKGLEFDQRSVYWTDLEKIKYGEYQSSHKTLPETFLLVEYYDKIKIENRGKGSSDEETYFARYAKTFPFEKKIKSEQAEVDTESVKGLKILRYSLDTQKDGQKIWMKVWVVEHIAKKKLFFFVALHKQKVDKDYGITAQKAIEDLELMLKSIRIK